MKHQVSSSKNAPLNPTPTESARDCSEFFLPQRQRQLQKLVYHTLILPCTEALEDFEGKRIERQQAVKQKQRQELNEIQRTQQQVERDWSEAQRALESLSSGLLRLYSQSCLDLSKFSIKPNPVPAWLNSCDFAGAGIDESTSKTLTLRPQAQQYFDNAETARAAISACSANARVYRPNSALLTGLFLTMSVGVALSFAKLVENQFAFPIVGLSFYGLLLFTWRTVKKAQLNSLFLEIENACGKCAARVNLYAKRAETEKTQLDENYVRLIEQTRQGHAGDLAQAEQAQADEFLAIKSRFSHLAAQVHEEISAFIQKAAYAGLDWHLPAWRMWAPDSSPEFAARLGTLSCSYPDLKEKLPEIQWSFNLPALVPFADGRALLFNASGKSKLLASAALQSVVIRALANTPPGKARFTLIDPVGLGHNVADLMPLGDYDAELISGKAWTEPQHIEQQLAKITEEMETVIQTYLRKQYPSLREYNADHPELAQPFRFLVVFDFPVNFTDASARRLTSIIKNGPRCGVFTLMLRDTAKALPYGYDVADLEDNAHVISCTDTTNPDATSFEWRDLELEGFTFRLDGAPPQEMTRAIIEKSGQMAAQGMKKEVPFEKLLAGTQKSESWRISSTAECLRVAIGPAGKGRPQELALGSGQDAHALLVGRTGSGKTNLMHVIITNLALTYSPAELQLYLVDFKGGVGFKRYAEFRLPHAKVIAIESEREFGLSILRGLDAELKRRSEVFRAAGVDNLAAHRAQADGVPPLPRILLVVDEFQELFVENDDLAQQAKIIFERLARQGRSFGVHFLLATQSLAGSAQLPTSIMGQIKVRIALPCTEADSRMILADDNKAARSLTRPGEAIYNPMGGLIEGNTPFQVALFNEERDLHKYLNIVTEMARAHQCSAIPIIFEGNELARTEDCEPLNNLLTQTECPQSKSVILFLGEPIAIQPPVAARLRRQSGSNLLIVTREESEGIGMCIASLISFLAQRPETSRVYIADFTTPDSEWAEHAEDIAASFPGDITVLGRQREIGSTIAAIAAEVRLRGDNAGNHGSIVLLLQGLHRIKALRENMDDEDGNNVVELLQQILRDGPELGVHVIAWADTVPNVTRGLGRKVINDFGLLVGAAMNDEDSMNLLNSMAASKINKAHRALFVDEDHPGQLVPFRPYAMPSAAWLKATGQSLRNRIPSTTI